MIYVTYVLYLMYLMYVMYVVYTCMNPCMHVCFGRAGLPTYSLSMLPGWLDRKRLGWLGQLHCFAFAQSCLHAIASYNSRSWHLLGSGISLDKPVQIWTWKKKPRLTCRCVLASVDVKCKDENDRSFELFLLIFRYWMLHKSGARKTRVITVWLDMVGLGWGNGAQSRVCMKPCYIVQRSRWCFLYLCCGVDATLKALKAHNRPTFGQANRWHLATLMQNCLLLGVNRLAGQAFGSCLT